MVPKVISGGVFRTVPATSQDIHRFKNAPMSQLRLNRLIIH